MREPPRVLVVDDDAPVRQFLEQVLAGSGCQTRGCATADEARRAAREGAFDVGVVDLHLGADDGVALLKELREIQPGLQAVVVTGSQEVESAVAAMKAGAYDYFLKPLDTERLSFAVARAAEVSAKDRELARLRAAAAGAGGFGAILGNSPALRKAVALAEQVAPSDAPVLLVGESGTGKELFARAIHGASRRAAGPLVAVNTAAIPSTLAESELFGHEAGSFTGAAGRRVGKFEEAHGGTLFLDEIEAMPVEMQPKVLRALQERKATRVGGTGTFPADARVVAATNRDLEGLIAEGKFRDDLYYRVAAVSIRMPPLRERQEDLPALAEHLLRLAAEREGKTIRGWSEEAMSALLRHAWPGNVRELQNVATHAALVCRGDRVKVEHLPERLARGEGGGDAEAIGPTLEGAVEALERWLIADALRRTGGNQTRAAELLGTTKRIMNYKVGQYGLGGNRGGGGATPGG